MQLAATFWQVAAVALQLAFSCVQVAVHCVATAVRGVKPGPVAVVQADSRMQASVMPIERTIAFLPP